MNNRKDVHTALQESFKNLILKHSFDKITIKMITDAAGFIRPTFYNHYADKYEVLEEICYEDIFKSLTISSNELVTNTLYLLDNSFAEILTPSSIHLLIINVNPLE